MLDSNKFGSKHHTKTREFLENDLHQSLNESAKTNSEWPKIDQLSLVTACNERIDRIMGYFINLNDYLVKN